MEKRTKEAKKAAERSVIMREIESAYQDLLRSEEILRLKQEEFSLAREKYSKAREKYASVRKSLVEHYPYGETRTGDDDCAQGRDGR